MASLPIGKYRHRIIVLSRSLAASDATGEEVESWPLPADGTQEYYAARESLTGSEQIAQGVRQTNSTQRLRVRGPSAIVTAVDRVKIKATGEIFNAVGVERDTWETFITIASLPWPTS